LNGDNTDEIVLLIRRGDSSRELQIYDFWDDRLRLQTNRDGLNCNDPALVTMGLEERDRDDAIVLVCGDQNIIYYPVDEELGIGASERISTHLTNLMALAEGDLDRDGDSDLVVHNGRTINVFCNFGGTLIFHESIGELVSMGPPLLGVADINADGRGDVIGVRHGVRTYLSTPP